MIRSRLMAGILAVSALLSPLSAAMAQPVVPPAQTEWNESQKEWNASSKKILDQLLASVPAELRKTLVTGEDAIAPLRPKNLGRLVATNGSLFWMSALGPAPGLNCCSASSPRVGPDARLHSNGFLDLTKVADTMAKRPQTAAVGAFVGIVRRYDESRGRTNTLQGSKLPPGEIYYIEVLAIQFCEEKDSLGCMPNIAAAKMGGK